MKKKTHPLSKRFVSGDNAVALDKQHVTPCADCPFARKAIKGWLGSLTADEWLRAAHGEALIDCHVTTNMQCAGAAIYRANVQKKCRERSNLELEENRTLVFSSQTEFKEHHEQPFGSAGLLQPF